MKVIKEKDFDSGILIYTFDYNSADSSKFVAFSELSRNYEYNLKSIVHSKENGDNSSNISIK